MEDKWELFWMGIIFFIVVMITVMCWNWRTDDRAYSAWVDGYITGYAEGKSGVPSRHPSPVERKSRD
jgi:hypothetical protein